MGEMMANRKAVNSVDSSDWRMVVRLVDNSACYLDNLMVASMVLTMVEMKVKRKDVLLETWLVEKTVHSMGVK